MAGSTTNLGLTKPTYSEDADIAVINTNMDTLDSKIGAVGSTSLQAQITSANEAIATLNSNLVPSMLDVQNKSYTSGSINDLPCGIYRIYNSVTQIPIAVAGYCSCYLRENGTKLQVYTSDTNRTFTRTKVSGTWSNWEELALKSDTVIASVTLTGSNVQYATNVYVRRTGHVMTVKINGLSALPNGGYTDICTLPSGFIPNDNLQCDVLVGTDNVATSLRTMRIRIETNGKLMLYNYGTQYTNTNVEITTAFIA